jgi:hypothetical protein
MNHALRTLSFVSACLLSNLAFVGCSDPAHIDTAPRTEVIPVEFENCAASDEWLPNTPPVEMFKPLPHPMTECPFYRGGWQNFLIAMQPQADGTPALLNFPTIDTAFTSRIKHPANRSYLGDVKQAGRREILIDRNGNSLYYGIHMNEAFKQFIADNDLKTSDKLQAYPKDQPGLFFPAGLTEFKSAWQIVEGDAATIAAETADYISMQTTVPTLTQDANGTIQEDRDKPLPVTVRLLAVHVVYTLPGHPEFIWASFEHSLGAPDSAAADGKRNVAPTFDGENPSKDDPNNTHVQRPASDHDFLLYKGGALVTESNVAKPDSSLHLVGQKFKDPVTGLPQSTSIYRMFPASKSNTTEPDEAITSLNNSVESLFGPMPTDKRGHYRLVGAQWMDKPDFFRINFPIQNDRSSPFAQLPPLGIGPDQFDAELARDGADSKYSILAGEDRMSSTAMESFTQPPGSFQNCFSCHNTRAINSNGVAVDDQKEGVKLLEPGLLNVSHVISQFILEDCYLPKDANIVDDPSNPGVRMAICPKFVAPQ